MNDVKCPRCGNPIQFMFVMIPMGRYVSACGCTDCNLIIQREGIISITLSDEEIDKIKQIERKEMMQAFEESMMRNHGITDRESADRYLQKCKEEVMRWKDEIQNDL